MKAPLVPLPPPMDVRLRYRIRPRENRSFNTPLDAENIVDPTRESTVRIVADGHGVTLSIVHPVLGGRIEETLFCAAHTDGLRSNRLDRTVFAGGGPVRQEHVDFTSSVFPLPACAYPEVMLPFLLSWQPHDNETRSLYAWINDRFVAKVQYKSHGVTKVDVAGKTVRAIEVVMYPDLNDWVPMGRVLTKLAQPLLPRYRMWFDPDAPHEVLRYEGPYGPPGAPEIVLERV